MYPIINEPTTGGIGIKSNTIVAMKVNKQFVNCNECNFELYYYTPISLQVDKTTGKFIDLINIFAGFINDSNNSNGISTFTNLVSGGSKSTIFPYHEIHNCDMYVCGNCYNCRIINASYRPEHEDVIYRINHTKKEFNILKKDYDAKYKPKKEIKDEIVTNKAEINKIQKNIEEKDVKELQKQEKDTKNEITTSSNLTKVNEESAKIIFERKTYKCSICEDTDFFETKTTIKRSKVFNVIGSTQYYFAHPAALYTCKTCLNSVFRYNFLDFPDPKYEYSK